MKINIKKITTYLLFSFFLLPGIQPRIDIPLVSPTPIPTATPTPTIVPLKLKPNLNILGKIKSNIGKRGWIEKGTVTAVSTSSITVTKESITYTVNTDANTTYRRRFGGESTLGEISVNDTVNVLGKWQNEEKTQIMATHIRNLSIQQRHMVFIGIVKSKTGSTIVLTTANKGEQTAYIISSTKLVNRKMEEIKMADILVGHRIRVKGIWDLTGKTIAEVTQIKDFSIPVQPSPKAE